MKPTFYLLFTLMFLLLGACQQGTRTAQTLTQDSLSTDTLQKSGADRDTHGCIGSAGYTWSEVQQRCLRLFEEGIKLTSASDTASTFAAYLVFSTDSSRAEFFTAQAIHLLTRADHSTYRSAGKAPLSAAVTPRSGWCVKQNGKLLYRQK